MYSFATLTSIDFLLPLIQAVPVVGVLGIVVVFLWKDNRSLVRYVREMDRANLDTLNDLSTILKTLVANTDKNKDILSNRIAEEAAKTRDHVSSRVEILEAKLSKNKED